MTELSNFIRFNDNGTLEGNIAALDFDFDITGEELNSTNPKAPVYRLYGVSPRGRKVEVGGIWRQMSKGHPREFFPQEFEDFKPTLPIISSKLVCVQSRPLHGRLPFAISDFENIVVWCSFRILQISLPTNGTIALHRCSCRIGSGILLCLSDFRNNVVSVYHSVATGKIS